MEKKKFLKYVNLFDSVFLNSVCAFAKGLHGLCPVIFYGTLRLSAELSKARKQVVYFLFPVRNC